ncbi:PfkB family carbohydrate kinase [Falsiroseomonas oryziterrae]|uniref:PfkB family carbohydrate kinase n=1 Tax=Falsiroseomonas oryziterrae TaxID=2911368 RepID=UPI001F3BE6EE|nr:PfkB family carbohydrate kinase [Roseomonas sp. NPKOSM-4]
MTAPRIVCCGIAVLDQAWDLPALPLVPGKYVAGGLRVVGGGMAATAAVAVAKLGGRSAWCGRLGADAAGFTLREGLRRHDVDLSGVTIARDGRSPTSALLVDPEGERILAVFPGEGLPDDAPVPASLVDDAAAVLADPRWVGGAERLFALAAARGLPRVLDADIAPRESLQRLAALADHVVFSQRGLVAFSGEADAARGLAMAASLLSGTLGVTLGAEGSLWWRDGTVVPVGTPRVAARDTTGCGDVFHGAYALAIAEGAPVLRAARFAAAAAALKAANGNGWDGMPDRAAVEAMLSAW